MQKSKNQKSEEEKLEKLVSQIKLLMVVVLVVVAVAAAYLFINKRGLSQESNAFAILFQAEKMEEEAYGSGGNPLREDIFSKIAEWDDEKKQRYQKTLKKVAEEYPKSVASRLSLLRLARFETAQMNYEGARNYIEELVSKKSKSKVPFYKSMAYETLGSVYEEEENWNDALKTYDLAISLKKNPFLAQAMMGKARSLIKLGRKDDAVQLYSEVSKQFPNSVYQRKADALKSLGI